MFLQLVSDMLKEFEPNLSKRKQLAINILKDIEKEEGHNTEKIKKKIASEGKQGILLRAKKRKKKKEQESEDGTYAHEEELDEELEEEAHTH